MEDIDFDELIYGLSYKGQIRLNESIFSSTPEALYLKDYIGGEPDSLQNIDFSEVKNKNFTTNSTEVKKISSLHWQIKAIVFNNCSFPEFTFSNLSNIAYLVFINCRFIELSFSEIRLEYLIFIDCNFENCLEIRDFDSPEAKLFGLFDTIKLNELNLINTKLEAVKITGSKSQIGSINIKNERINTLELSNVKSIQSLEIEASNTHAQKINEGQSFKIKKTSIEQITFKNLNWDFVSFEIDHIKNTKNLNFEECSLETDINIKDSDIENIKFSKKCRVQNLNIINNKSPKSNLEFLDSHSERSIFLKNCNFNQIEIDNSVMADFYIQNEKEREIKGKKIHIIQSKIQEILIDNCFVEDFSIVELQENRNLKISECIFVSLSVSFSEKIDIKSNFDIQDVYLHRSILVSYGNFQSVILNKILCHNTLELFKCKYSKSINFSSCFVFDKLMLSECELEGVLIENSISKRLNISSATKLTSNKIRFSKSQLSIFDIQEGELLKIEYYFLKSGINSVNFNNLTLPKESIISFSDTTINRVNFLQCNFSGGLFFRNIKTENDLKDEIFQSLNLGKDKFESWRSIILGNIDILFRNSEAFTLSIQYSTLGSAEFTEFKFDEYEFVFNNSKILNTFIAGSQFPDKIKTKSHTEPQNLEDYNQLVLAYNQLKKVAENNGDIVKSSLMHSRAMEYQEKVLFETEGKEYDKFVFWLNGISNNHGENWFGSIRFIVIGTLFFFFFFALFEHKELIWCEFPQLFFRDYIQFINPLVKIDVEKLNWKSTILLFFSKIYVGYGIYQLITAFRRHGKK